MSGLPNQFKLLVRKNDEKYYDTSEVITLIHPQLSMRFSTDDLGSMSPENPLVVDLTSNVELTSNELTFRIVDEFGVVAGTKNKTISTYLKQVTFAVFDDYTNYADGNYSIKVYQEDELVGETQVFAYVNSVPYAYASYYDLSSIIVGNTIDIDYSYLSTSGLLAVQVEYSSDNGATWSDIQAVYPASSTASIEWTPSEVGTYIIRTSDYQDATGQNPATTIYRTVIVYDEPTYAFEDDKMLYLDLKYNDGLMLDFYMSSPSYTYFDIIAVDSVNGNYYDLGEYRVTDRGRNNLNLSAYNLNKILEIGTYDLVAVYSGGFYAQFKSLEVTRTKEATSVEWLIAPTEYTTNDGTIDLSGFLALSATAGTVEYSTSKNGVIKTGDPICDGWHVFTATLKPTESSVYEESTDDVLVYVIDESATKTASVLAILDAPSVLSPQSGFMFNDVAVDVTADGDLSFYSSLDGWIEDEQLMSEGVHEITAYLDPTDCATYLASSAVFALEVKDMVTAQLEESLAINVYPNPSASEFTLETPETGVLQVYNVQGELLLNTKIENTYVFGNDFVAGVYIVQFVSNQQLTTLELVKE